jgi:hypothetical protein
VNKRFEVIDENYNEIIRDVEHNTNLFFLAASGFGVNSTTRNLAKRVVDFLNSLPAEETIPYPDNVKTKGQ